MTQPAPHPRTPPVDPSTGEIHPDAPSYAELDALYAEALDKCAGYQRTVDRQARDIGGLERRLKVEDDPTQHPKAKEIADLIERWKKATDHPRAKASKDRFDVIRARLKDGYSIEQLELAVDGIAAFPYVINGQRVPTGKPSQRHDALSIALKGGENLERFANLGAQARRVGVE